MSVSIVGLFALIIGLAGLAVWIYALVDAIRTPDDRLASGTQLVWVLVILIGNVIGAVLYLVIGRSSGPSGT